MQAALKDNPLKNVSRPGRKSTLLHATREFVSLERPSIKDVARYRELFYPLCLKATKTERATLSALLAGFEYTPRPIVLFLALDDITIARPCLNHSNVLSERDLIEFTRKGLPLHLQEIAKRSDLTSGVVSALLRVDDDAQTLYTLLLQNRSIAGTFDIQTLMRRAMLTPAPAQRVETRIPELPVLTMTDPAKTEDLSEALLSLASMGGKTGRGTSPKQPDVQPQASAEIIGRLIGHARAHDHNGFCHVIQRLCQIGRHQTQSAITSGDAGFLAVVLKANGVPQAVSARILLMLVPDVGRNVALFKRILDRFRSMEVHECRLYLETRGADFTPQRTYEYNRATPPNARGANVWRDVLASKAKPSADEISYKAVS
ncbi:MAG: DUF2336 domain-containing protein [Pseudomonadota bacterium]